VSLAASLAVYLFVGAWESGRMRAVSAGVLTSPDTQRIMLGCARRFRSLGGAAREP